jgi:hypothetical protein
MQQVNKSCVNILGFLIFLGVYSTAISAAELTGFWTPPTTAPALEAESNAALVRARAARDRLLAVQGPRTIENTL